MPGDSPASFIPSVRLENSEIWDALHDRLEELVARGAFILGPEVEEFEQAAASAFQTAHAVGVSSGTSALMLALRVAPMRRGARVALPANTFFATLEAVILAGHQPVIVDHDEDYLLSIDDLESLDVDAVIPVHLYGLPVDMLRLMELAQERGLWVLEDCSQAHGATIAGRPVGALGHAGAFSAYPTKNLGAWGDAGFVTTNDPVIDADIRALRHHGQGEPNEHMDIASADRLDSLQALVLTEKLRRLADEVASRRRVGEWYRESLGDLGLELPGDRGSRTHVYHQFVVRVPHRARVRERMAELGVGTGIHYPTPIHLQPGAAGHVDVPTPPKRAEAWAGEILSLPMYPSLSKDEVGRVSDALRASLRT